MDHKDLILGELREFKRATIKELAEIKSEVKSLHNFKSKVIGAAATASFLMTGIAEIILRFFKSN